MLSDNLGAFELFISIAWALAMTWLIGRALAQRGLLPEVQQVGPGARPLWPKIAVVVPARDEAANIIPCVQSLVAQQYPAERFNVLVVDDHSSDETPCLVESFAASHANVRLSKTPSLPLGWVGKSHACWIGAQAADRDIKWLCFIDADVKVKPALLTSAVKAAIDDGLDLLSLAPRQELGSIAERLVLPCGFYLLAFRQDLRKLQSPYGQDATATGQFLLIRREAYEAVGGHAAICREICEDVALARCIKRTGRRVVLRDGRQLLSARMYRGWRTLWPGIGKNLVDMLGGLRATVAVALAAMLLSWAAWLVPLVDAVSCAHGVRGACLALAIGGTGSAAAFGLHIVGTSFFRIPLWYGLIFPLGYSAGVAMALDSIRRRLTGRITWKGRTYP